MTLKNPHTGNVQPTTVYTDNKNKGSFKGYAVISMGSFTGRGMVNITLTTVTGAATGKDSINKQAANVFINRAFTSWNSLLKSKAGITMNNLGFTAFTGLS